MIHPPPFAAMSPPKAYIGAAPNSTEELPEYFSLTYQNILPPACGIRGYSSYARGTLPEIMLMSNLTKLQLFVFIGSLVPLSDLLALAVRHCSIGQRLSLLKIEKASTMAAEPI